MRKTVNIILLILAVFLVGCSSTGEKENERAKRKLEDVTYKDSLFFYCGTGDDVVTNVTVEDVSFLRATSWENGYFSIKAHYGDEYDLLVNTAGSYVDGCTLLLPNREYTFEILAKGDWSIEGYKIGTSSSDSFCGNGDSVTPLFLASTDIYNIETNADGYFAVKGYREDGSYDLLVNTKAPYSGRIMFKNEGEYAFFTVVSEGEWSIIADDNDEPVSVNIFEDGTEEAIDDMDGVETTQEQSGNQQNDSLLTQEQQDAVKTVEDARRRNTFMLAMVQDDLESYYWEGDGQYADVWQQLFVDCYYDANITWSVIKNDLDIYNDFGTSDYADIWITTGAIYDKYDSGELKETLPEDMYQQLIDRLNAVTSRLGIFYSSRELADSSR